MVNVLSLVKKPISDGKLPNKMFLLTSNNSLD